MSSREFQRYFQEKYLSERYYDNKAKEFYELKLGKLLATEYTTKFLELLRYVLYLKDEKPKIQGYLVSCHKHSGTR